MNNRFSIAVGVEGVAEFLEFFAQLAVVINLTIEHNPGRLITVVDRLLPAGEIDNRKATHPQPDLLVEIKTILVGPAMPDRLAHATHQRLVHIAIAANNAYYSTHNSVIS
jgi:hypothetical protein